MSHTAPLGDPALHFWLTRSVARSMGVSLGDAMAEGVLSKKDYADLVTNCRRCALVAHCEAWLGDQGNGAQTAPDGCVHADLFEHLKQQA
ncbi:DUF6455 family protein [Shimia thalassica]|uniref:DUF6455 family protein n=1 Tax=Shimia thalassica TaxID=1715693 RepID=UPI0026E44C7D|nr:DUF6455 family protein [Shimia thalassica]MDO6478419.1 DUF6455 family protein [Shimia thalassica]